jgi:four helix bundle protein
MLQTFEDLEVWKRSCQLAVEVCVITHEMKNFALRDQMQRSAISIPSNIAEGSERDSPADFSRFLRYAKSSSGELRTQLYLHKRINERLGLPVPDNHPSLISETKELAAMTQGLINSLSR